MPEPPALQIKPGTTLLLPVWPAAPSLVQNAALSVQNISSNQARAHALPAPLLTPIVSHVFQGSAKLVSVPISRTLCQDSVSYKHAPLQIAIFAPTPQLAQIVPLDSQSTLLTEPALPPLVPSPTVSSAAAQPLAKIATLDTSVEEVEQPAPSSATTPTAKPAPQPPLALPAWTAILTTQLHSNASQIVESRTAELVLLYLPAKPAPQELSPPMPKPASQLSAQ